MTKHMTFGNARSGLELLNTRTHLRVDEQGGIHSCEGAEERGLMKEGEKSQ